MKYILIFICIFSFTAFAQFDIDLDLEKKIEKKVNEEINDAADDAIDETAETIKKGGDGGNNKEEKKNPETDVAVANIIFEDNLNSEEIGEFPSLWDLLSGSAEIASLGGNNVIHLVHNNSIIIPLMNKKDFLPEVFTIDFDVFFEKDGATRSDIYKIRFFNGTNDIAKINGKRVSTVDITWNSIKMGQFGGNTKSYTGEKKKGNGKWKHITATFNKKSLKLYMDEERVLNIPNLGFKPKMFSIGGHYDDRYIKMSYIKNIRVNEGVK